MNKFAILISSLVVFALATGIVRAQSFSGAGLFEEHCAICHGNPDPATQAPDRQALRELTPEVALESMTTGTMAALVPGLTEDERRAIAEWTSGRLLGSTAADISVMTNHCEAEPLGYPLAGTNWNGWGPNLRNTRFQPASAAGLTPKQVGRLKVKWAFAFPNGNNGSASPVTAAGGRIYIGANTGQVYALNADTGCVYWSFGADAAVRSSVTVGPVTGMPDVSYAAFFGDIRTNVYAVNAENGELLWRTKAEEHSVARITASPTLHAGRLFVPISSLEELAGAYPHYACCTFRGSVVAYDASTGEQLWKTYSIAEEPGPTFVNSAGVQQWAPAGGAVWNPPVIDVDRGALYVGTGNGYTVPAAPETNAVLALDMDTGERLWVKQLTAYDSFLGSCYSFRGDDERFLWPAALPGGFGWDWEGRDARYVRHENCGPSEPIGPDNDTDLQNVILHTLPDGRTIIVGGQQNGRVFAVDPDRQGELIWEVFPGQPQRKNMWSGVTFGGAIEGNVVYMPINLFTPVGGEWSSPAHTPGGVAAVRIETGEVEWFTPTPTAPCIESEDSECVSGGLNAAATAIPGVVFSGGQDGILRAYSTDGGQIIWEYDTAREYETVNGVAGRGGGLNGAGPAIVNGMLYVASGSSGLQGNVLLAFAPGE